MSKYTKKIMLYLKNKKNIALIHCQFVTPTQMTHILVERIIISILE